MNYTDNFIPPSNERVDYTAAGVVPQRYYILLYIIEEVLLLVTAVSEVDTE